MKTKLTASLLFVGLTAMAGAATASINNVAAGPGDFLYADGSNNLMTGAIVTLGTFTTGFDVTANLGNFTALIENFTPLTSGLTGNASASLGGSFAGYAEYDPVDIGSITGANALLGQTLYSFVGNLGTLAESDQFGLLDMGPLRDDVPVPNDYSSNPDFAVETLIGDYGTFVGDAGAGQGTYNTFQLVPEPSSALLGVIGAMCFLRRRRN